MTYLKTKGLWSVIESDPPQASEETAAWTKKDMEALNVLVQTLSSSQTSYVLNQATAKGVWQKLEQVNRGRVLDRKISLKRELNAIEWKKGERAIDYMQRVEYLGEQLRSLGESLEDAELAAIAIQGLPKAYYGVARSFDICALADVTPDKVRYALLREEERLNQCNTADEAACNVKVRTTSPRRRAESKPDFVCYRCGKPGHIARNCWSTSNRNMRFRSANSERRRDSKPPAQRTWRNASIRQDLSSFLTIMMHMRTERPVSLYLDRRHMTL